MQVARFTFGMFAALLLGFGFLDNRVGRTQDMPAQTGHFEATAGNISRALSAFEKMACGLQFERSLIVEGKSRFTAKISISDNGAIRKSISEHTSANGFLLAGSYCNRNEGWCFSANVYPNRPIDPQSPDEGKPRLRVDFSALGQDPATFGNYFGDYFLGFASRRSFSGFLKESKTTAVVDLLDKVSYVGIRCEHPTLATLTIYFDDNGRVAWINEECSPGDLVPGSKFEPDKLVPADRSTNNLLGPFEYQTFEGRDVLKRCNQKISARNPKPVVFHSHHEFTKYAKLTDKLSRKIGLLEFDLVNGSRVTCTGNPVMNCEYRNGKVVVVADAKSVEGAEEARYWRSGSGWFRFYSICGFGFALVFGFLVWYRNRG